MSDYTAPVADILFTMKAVAGLEALNALPGYADATPRRWKRFSKKQASSPAKSWRR